MPLCADLGFVLDNFFEFFHAIIKGMTIKKYQNVLDDAKVAYGVFGENGGVIITDTSVHVPSAADQEFNCLYPLEDTVIAAATTPEFSGSLAGLQLKAGIPFYGRCTSVQLTSGKLIAYVSIVSG